MKKIMFSEQYGLQQAVLEGRKTMTRRPLSKRAQDLLDAYTKGVCVVPECAIPDGVSIEEFAEQFAKYPGKVVITRKDTEATFTPSKEEILEKVLTYSTYKVGDVVAIAQRYSDIMPYLADSFYQSSPDYMKNKPGYKNKMYVNADLMPNKIRITKVRIERIQDISEDDCLREGIYETEHHSFGYPPSERQKTFHTKIYERYDAFSTPKNAFAALINKLSGRKAWDDNPCVFVYEFELVK